MLWDLVPGQRLDRSDVHARFGGLARGRISPSRASENILLFTTPTTIASAFDGWTGDRVLFGGTGGSNGGALVHFLWASTQGDCRLSSDGCRGRPKIVPTGWSGVDSSAP